MIPAILWAGMIFFFSSVPDLHSGLPDIFDIVLRKIAHTGEYAILAILLLRGFSATKQWQKQQKLFVIVMVIVILYAISDEIHQGFVPGRIASPIDVLIDAFGAILCLSIFYKIKNRSK